MADFGDLRRLAESGALKDVRIRLSAHTDPARRYWIVSGETRARRVSVDAASLESAISRLCQAAVADDDKAVA